MSETISIEGPVELVEGKLTLQIPLAAGGDKLAPLARGIGEVVGEGARRGDSALARTEASHWRRQSCSHRQLQWKVYDYTQREER